MSVGEFFLDNALVFGEGVRLDLIVLKYLHCIRHVAQFIAMIGGGDDNCRIAVGKLGPWRWSWRRQAVRYPRR